MKPQEPSKIISLKDIQEIKTQCNVLIGFLARQRTPENIKEQIIKLEKIKFIVENKTEDYE
jgi:hypothetical protein